MKAFLKQIFKSNRWEHISQDTIEMVNDGYISDFWVIVISFIGTFLLGWGVGALAKAGDPTSLASSFVFGIMIGGTFALISCIKCYYEYRKQKIIDEKID